MTSKLGMHWIRVHPDGRDLSHVERMQYPSAKLFEWHWSDRDACRDLLTVLPRNAYILARDHPLSEQPIWDDPVGIGTRQADEWAGKVRDGRYHLPTDRSFFLGRNEPDATTGDRAAIDRYTTAFLDRLQVHGLRGGAFNFSTGHPRTVDGTRNTPADYSVFERSHQAIVRGHHIGVLHIYGTAAVPLVPGHYDRLRACDWQDVEWVVGECAADEHVIGGGAHDGYLRSMSDNPVRYCDWLDDFIIGINDPRIHSYQVFTYDYSHPWDSFDTRPIRDALETYDWQHVKAATTPPHTQHIPSVMSPGPTVPSAPGPTPPPQEVQPTMPTGIIEPRVAQAILNVESGGRTHGNDGKVLIRFEAHIFATKVNDYRKTGPFFRYDAQRGWVNQEWRRFEGDAWKPIHTGAQADEYAAFEFARSINADAAYQSISVGAAQIVGFNHAKIGYPTAEAMFRSFNSAPMQMVGFLNFLLATPGMMEAIRNKDWNRIALLYNGAGNVPVYSKLLREAYERLGS